MKRPTVSLARAFSAATVVALAAFAAPPSATAQEPATESAPAATSIEWAQDLPAALAAAKKAERIVMVCINAKKVDGGRVEPAAKGLREVVYKDKRVVDRAADFVCVLLTAEGSSKEYDALRALGIDGDIVSPQHVFVNATGDRILYRKEYWSFGKGERAVEALLGMMTKAEEAAGKAAAEGAEDVDGPPQGDVDRAHWIAETVERIGDESARESAVARLVAHDKDGDCVDALIAALETHEKDAPALVAIVRGLGQDGLERAALPVAELLDHKDDAVRANAAVSLEYIGCREKKVVAALKKAAGKEKDEGIANHVYRALGRCGTEDAKARSTLLSSAAKAKSEFASYGPCIGLAYFEGDTKAMRGVEKMLKTIGIPGGRRGGGGNVVKRGLVSWTLANIGDKKSAVFVRNEMMDGLKNIKAFWVEALWSFWETVAQACEGEEGKVEEVESGVRGFVQFARRRNLSRYGAEDRHLMDDARRERDKIPLVGSAHMPPEEAPERFKPKGDGMLDTGDDV